MIVTYFSLPLVVISVLVITAECQTPQPLSVHVLDTETGGNAANMTCKLYRVDANQQLTHLSTQVTNEQGRIPTFLPVADFTPGIYRVRFETKKYYKAKHVHKTFFPFVQFTVNLTNPLIGHHVPLVLSPFGFSTYRGG